MTGFELREECDASVNVLLLPLGMVILGGGGLRVGGLNAKDKNLEGKCKTRSLKFHASIKLKDHIMLHSNPVCIN